MREISEDMKESKQSLLPEVPYVDVIIFGGQSNMQGQSEALTDSRPVSGAYEYRWLTNSLVPLKNPVGEDIKNDRTQGYAATEDMSEAMMVKYINDHLLCSACYGYTNLVPKFCESYISRTGSAVIAVSAAKGSTSIKEWLPDTPGYEMLVEKAKAAIRKASAETVVRNVFFVWLQGESDALKNTAKSAYKDAMLLLNRGLKHDVGIHMFGVIRVGRYTKGERDDVIIRAQDEVCAENDGFLMLTTIAAELNRHDEYMNLRKTGHFNAKGLERLGSEAGASLGEFANMQIKPARI